MMHLGCYLVDRALVPPRVDGAVVGDEHPGWFDPALVVRPAPPAAPAPGGPPQVLEQLAFARSGEKGETVNVGVIARDPAHLPALRAALNEAALRDWLPDLGPFRLTVYDLPGFAALNLVLDGALPGGLNASQRLDPAAKSIAQRLMRFPVSA